MAQAVAQRNEDWRCFTSDTRDNQVALHIASNPKNSHTTSTNTDHKKQIKKSYFRPTMSYIASTPHQIDDEHRSFTNLLHKY